MKHLTKKQSKIRALLVNLLEGVEESGLYTPMEMNYIHSKFFEVSDSLEDDLEKSSDMIESGSWKV